jgi:hypothetical protein
MSSRRCWVTLRSRPPRSRCRPKKRALEEVAGFMRGAWNTARRRRLPIIGAFLRPEPTTRINSDIGTILAEFYLPAIGRRFTEQGHE